MTEAEEQHLLAFCAYRRVLRLKQRDDYIAVEQRLVALGRDRNPPGPIRNLMDRLHVTPGNGSASAEALLPHTVS